MIRALRPAILVDRIRTVLGAPDRDPASIDALVAELVLKWAREPLPDGTERWRERTDTAPAPRILGPGDRWWTSSIDRGWELVEVLTLGAGGVSFGLRRAPGPRPSWYAEFHAGAEEPPADPAGATARTPAVAIAPAALALTLVVPDLVWAFTAAHAEPPLAGALVRGARLKVWQLVAAGGGLTAAEVAAALGTTPNAVEQARGEDRLLGVQIAGEVVYPRAQFDSRGQLLPGLERALRGFRLPGDWMRLGVLLARDERLGGRTPFEALAAGDTDAVVECVSDFGEMGL